MQLKYKTVIFDLDGTLLESAPGVINAVRYALNKLNLPFPAGLDAGPNARPDAGPNAKPDARPNASFDERKLIGPPLKSSYQDILGVSPNLVEQAVNLHREYYGSKGAYESKLYPGVGALVKKLHQAGAQVCVATSKFHVVAKEILAHYDLMQFITYSAMSDGTELSSKKAEMIAKVLDFCKSSPQSTVMVGDTYFDLEGAKQNNVPFIGVLFGYGSRCEMQGANYFVNNISELEKVLFV